jgi:hypothetical protein
MTAKCLTYSPYYPIGPVLAQLLVGDNHYNRLAGVLPNLIKLELFSAIDDTINITPRQLSSSKKWSKFSLPAKYICRGTDPAPAISTEAYRPEPYTIINHDPSRGRYERTKSSTVDQIIIPITVEAILPGQVCPHSGINGYIRDFQGLIDDCLEGILPILSTDRERLVIRLYGWFESCECGSTREGFAKIANAMGFVHSRCEYRLPLDINFEFFPLGDMQLCQVCGE